MPASENLKKLQDISVYEFLRHKSYRETFTVVY